MYFDETLFFGELHAVAYEIKQYLKYSTFVA